MRWLWITGLGSLTLLAGLALFLRDLQPGVLALQFAWSPRSFGWIIHSWSPEQLARYRTHLGWDGLLLLAYGSFGWLLATRTRLFQTGTRAGRALARLTLPAAAAADLAENLLHLWLTEVPRFGVPLPYALATGASVLKWSLLLLFCALALRALWTGADSPDAASP